MSLRFSGSKSNFAILNEEQVRNIKIDLMNGLDIKSIAKQHNVKPACINNIRKNYRWKNVFVDGFEDFARELDGQWHKLSDDDIKDIIEMFNNGILKNKIRTKYGICYEKINKIISQS